MSLSAAEQQHLVEQLQRKPNALEKNLVTAMWSEHCSYKSSRELLARLPSTSSRTLTHEGENAGAVRIGKDKEGNSYALVFKMESHNHPSMITPHDGAATGVGGIMRDVLAMGARPIANLNALRFGKLQPEEEKEHEEKEREEKEREEKEREESSKEPPQTRRLLKGVVEGIAFYGNCTGIPTIGGECDFDADYDDNILVNAMTVGIARTDLLCTARAEGEGNLVVYLGAKTGRDGIDGATMASKAFDRRQGTHEGAHENKTQAEEDPQRQNKTQVQVGDPFAQKRLLEACLEATSQKLLQALQDMGAAGLLSSSSEMAAKGNITMTLDLDKVPTRQKSLSPLEMMLSESQERMLAVVEERHLATLSALFARHRLDCRVIGRLGAVSAQPLLTLRMHDSIQASLPVHLLGEAPAKHHKRTRRAAPKPVSQSSLPAELPPVLSALRTLLLSPRLLSKEWITQQYDSLVGGQTLEGPGGEAALLRLRQTGELLAVVSDATPRYCRNDAKRGAMQAVCEAVRNLSAVGATPLAITDNLNFGNPENPLVMGDAEDTIEGIATACRAFDLPVVSGNVSFYNETEGRSIPPTPVIGAIGIIETREGEGALPPFARALPSSEEERLLFLLGTPCMDAASLGASLYMQEVVGERHGAPPAIDFAEEQRNAAFLRDIVARGLCRCVRDLSCGGLLVKLALLVMQTDESLHAGAQLQEGLFEEGLFEGIVEAQRETAFWFGERQARYLLCLTEERAHEIADAAERDGVSLLPIGRLIKERRLTLPSGQTMPLTTLLDEWRGGLARRIGESNDMNDKQAKKI